MLPLLLMIDFFLGNELVQCKPPQSLKLYSHLSASLSMCSKCSRARDLSVTTAAGIGRACWTQVC